MLKDRGYVDDVDLVEAVGPSLARQDRIAELEDEIAQLREALTRRQQYGVVTGMLAMRFGIPPDRAWQLLVRLSQHSNLKIQVIARILHDRAFGQLAAEDMALAVRLDAQLPGQLSSLVAVVAADGEVPENRRLADSGACASTRLRPVVTPVDAGRTQQPGPGQPLDPADVATSGSDQSP